MSCESLLAQPPPRHLPHKQGALPVAGRQITGSIMSYRDAPRGVWGTGDAPYDRSGSDHMLSQLMDLMDAGEIDPADLSPTEEPPEPRPKKNLKCTLCEEPKYMNELLPDVYMWEGDDGDGVVGASGDWQGVLRVFCEGCADQLRMLTGTDKIRGGNRAIQVKSIFKKEAKRRWKHRGVLKVSRTRMMRARNYYHARELYEAAHPGNSRRSQVPFVKLAAMASRMAADINGMIPARVREAEAAFAEYRSNCAAEQEESACGANNKHSSHPSLASSSHTSHRDDS